MVFPTGGSESDQETRRAPELVTFFESISELYFTCRKQQKKSVLEEPQFASENCQPAGGNPGLPPFMADDDEFGGLFSDLDKPMDKRWVSSVHTWVHCDLPYLHRQPLLLSRLS